ncbi:TIGR03643 family protein [Marinospirillum celere]|uniref:TIGR03643 family protein n=1 Tax=Marinospirillum celere TaxID=1122252 RepID=A0A1I1E392_9GAMM|nr:TIGR03643 family protein [Marinospirillum celere]SFB79400.1 TIGR03643 family protein [Marinospirillum celere]
MSFKKATLSEAERSRIIEMAWEDRTPFEAIKEQFGLNEKEVRVFMRQSLKPGSFKLWRKRVSGRATKHLQLRSPEVSRGYCPTQYKQR